MNSKIIEKAKFLYQNMTNKEFYQTNKIINDISDYMRIDYNYILYLENNFYLITRNAVENRFGIEGDQKYWVKYAFDLKTKKKKILKLVFHEVFATKLRGFKIIGERSPDKETKILDEIKNNPRFMQGKTLYDSVGNSVRVIDFIYGNTLYNHILQLSMSHEEYFYQLLPKIIAKIIPCLKAIKLLHEKNQHHGDIRTDHIIIQNKSKKYIWIDFDFKISHLDYDLWCIGNLITFIVGKGEHIVNNASFKNLKLTSNDTLFLLKNRIANLKKIFKYIPNKLNNITMNFTSDHEEYYDSIDQIIDDLCEVFF